MSPHRNKQLLALATLALAACTPRSIAPNPERYENLDARFSMVRPAGWYEYPAQAAAEARRRVETDDPALQEAIKDDQGANLITFAKFKPPSSGAPPQPGRPLMNPSIQVAYAPAAEFLGMPPTEFLRRLTVDYSKSFPDMELVDPIGESTVAGRAAAHMRFRFTLAMIDGTRFRVISRKWVVPRGRDLFLINMVGPAEGRQVCEAEFNDALASIRLKE